MFYLPKLNRGLGLPFGAHFLHIFFVKMLLINNISIDKVSMLYIFFFSRNQTKCVIKLLFRYLIMPQTLTFILDHAPKQWLKGEKKRGRQNY